MASTAPLSLRRAAGKPPLAGLPETIDRRGSVSWGILCIAKVGLQQILPHLAALPVKPRIARI